MVYWINSSGMGYLRILVTTERTEQELEIALNAIKASIEFKEKFVDLKLSLLPIAKKTMERM